MTKIIGWFKEQEQSTKNIIYVLTSLVGFFLAIKISSNSNFIFLKTSGDRKVKIEVYDMCLDSLSYEDSCEIISTLMDVEFKPKKINFIAVHCTAGPVPKRETTKADWEHFFYKEKYPGAKMVGYNYLVDINKVIALKPINKNQVIEKHELVWGVAGFNSQTVSIAYIGGLVKEKGKWVNRDTRTPRQKFLLDSLTKEIIKIVPTAKIQGHRKFPNVKKTCPNYEI